MDNNKFENFISCGFNCAVALSMKRFGIRSFSSPFDWCKCSFAGILKTLDNDFSEFLNKDNLEYTSEINFKDTKYNFQFFHEANSDIKKEIDSVILKYQKRVFRFKEEIKKKTCFIRAVASQNEYEYIIKNFDYINKVIKKTNKNNEIIFLIPNFINADIELKFLNYRIDLDSYVWKEENKLSKLLEYDNELVNFLINSYDNSKRLSNLHFINKNEAQKNRYRLLVNVLKTNYSLLKLPKKVAIYGIGYIGEAFFDKIKTLTEVKYFIDSKNNNKTYKDIQILNLDNLSNLDVDEIIITPVFEFNKIKNKLKEKLNSDIKISSLNDYLNFNEIT